MTRARTISISVALGALLVLGACGPYHFAPPVPARPMAVAGFEVIYGPRIPGDRQRLLNRMRVPEEMAIALRSSYATGPGPMVRVTITQFRAGRWGPTRMHALVQVLGPQQNVLSQYETDSTSVYGDRTQKIRAVAQDIINQVAQQL